MKDLIWETKGLQFLIFLVLEFLIRAKVQLF